MEETREVKESPKSEYAEIRVSSKLLYSLFGIVALGILIVCKICASFGVGNGTFYGIMSIFIYVLPFCGIIFNYMSKHEMSTELWINIVVLGIALLCMI